MQTETPDPGTVPAVQYQRFGTPEVLRVVSVSAPAAGPHDLVVGVRAQLEIGRASCRERV